MWQQQYEKDFDGVLVEDVWSAWENVNSWHKWDHEIEFAKLEQSFAAGSIFTLKPKGGPNVRIQLIDVQKNSSFLDVTSFPFAKMYDLHEVSKNGTGVKIKNKIWVTGPLGFLWKMIVAKGVADGVPVQTDSLIKYVKEKK